ncbi:L1 [Leptonychotes weddellii papillomavirus 5]|uniref:Major capsid protein L1 n=1 Tax=Leptonychotes weddellii papillomavirus 5 TaxID=2077306 RepID=A0A2I8B2Q5_9PAPI|nr:L1 [Leptonychotes weddellii papillomavirus 5]AUT11922.1 L1 [Leptonychotes weddellii papillomavirus 5]
MASYWVPPQSVLYLPPSTPVSKVMNTDEFVIPTDIFYHASSERLLTIGHPYFDVKKTVETVDVIQVPKVSGNQYRVFRVLLPDPNKFALSDTSVYSPERERLVWKLRGLEIGRGGPLGFGTTGHPLMDRLSDTENGKRDPPQSKGDNRTNISMDPKQTQLFVVGCEPCLGEHWDVAENTTCEKHKGDKPEDCPALELMTSYIEDGDMCDIGFGAFNFAALQETRSGVPLDILGTTCKYPDYLKMANEKSGDHCFFFGKREQVYCRHMFVREGKVGEEPPESLYYKGQAPARETLSGSIYYGTPSGSLVNSDTQLFNRPFWLNKAQGKNNGILWNNNIFVTVVDNTRNINFTISKHENGNNGVGVTYETGKYRHYLRHAEEFELSFIVQLCKVSLDPDILSHIHAMNPDVLDLWNLGFVPPQSSGIESTYRYLKSKATKCTEPGVDEPKDPYADFVFWNVDLKERLSLELDQYSLGRKFLHQSGLSRTGSSMRSKRSSSSRRKSSSKKRKTK